MKASSILWSVTMFLVSVLLILGASCVVKFAILPQPTTAAPPVIVVNKGGWKTDTDGVRYLDKYGNPFQNWIEINGKRYYFTPGTGYMVTGWQTIDDQRYYFAEDGVMLSDWQVIDGKTVYLDSEGRLITGLQVFEEKIYYFQPDGSMHTGWLELDGKRYYFEENGVAATGWLTLDGKNYYLTPDGSIPSGWQTLNDTLHYFTEGGYTLTGWADIDGIQHRLDALGSPVSGWLTDEGGRYHLDENGCPMTGWLELDGKQYYFDENGVATTGWLELDREKYYFFPNGVMARGEVVINGVPNFFTASGKHILLVNHNVPVPEDYTLDLVAIEDHWDSFDIDRNAKPALEAMMNEMWDLGYLCEIYYGFRSKDFQQQLWDNSIKRFMNQGKTYEEAVVLTSLDTMAPGHSEHQTGLAVDLNCTAKGYAWLAEHCWEYGFILRYPAGKTEFTGIMEEEWHFRYVGVEFAMELKESGMCLEEYMISISN